MFVYRCFLSIKTHKATNTSTMFLFIDVFCRSKPTKQQRQTHKASKPTKQQGNMVVQAVAMADVGLVAAHRAIACPVASLRYMHSHEHGKTSNLSPCLFPHSLCFHLVATRYRSDSRPTFKCHASDPTLLGLHIFQIECWGLFGFMWPQASFPPDAL